MVEAGNVPVVQKDGPLHFYGSQSSLEALERIYPKIVETYEIVRIESSGEPGLCGFGMYAQGWRQMQVFDPAFEPF